MKTIGLIGGTTWYSTIDYYRYINLYVNEHLGGDEAAKIIINSVNYGEIKRLTKEDRWDEISAIICNAALQLQLAGADCLLIGANTMHNVAQDVVKEINIPLIHIATETAKEIKALDIDTIALLGTKYTMELNFFRDILAEHGIKTILPSPENMDKINTAIYEELGKGLILDPTKKLFLEIIDKLAGAGADGIILGCTEIPLLIKPADCPLPVFDTTAIHAKAAVKFALAL
jgi:aspartate racemase